ncbi:MAG TPA: VCBS repeat-containing protein [Bacteroidia bacterium]|nr:VCBS repeat-containing protein [Bacteroidia bacterium]
MKKIIPNDFNWFQLLAISLCFAGGCSSDEKREQNKIAQQDTLKEKLFTKIPASESGVDFVNSLTETDSFNIFVFEYIYNGGGVAMADINNDNLPDIFLAGNQSSCQLFLNEGNLHFKNITKSAGVNTDGWCTGIAAADVNADGLTDFYVCRSNPLNPPERRANLLFINNGNSNFTESAKAYGLDNKGYSTHATFFDYDRDNDLDMFLINHPEKNEELIYKKIVKNAKYDPYESAHLFRNNGDQTFTDITQSAGVASYAFGLSASISDFNNDGYPDIYVCNDYTMSDFLYINNKNGTFTDKLYSYFRHTSHFSMGSDIGELNNDGLPDLVQLDMLPEDNHRQKIMGGPDNYDKYMLKINNGYGHQLMKNCLQLNNGNGSFSEIAELAGISKTDWSWAPLIADFDNDGYNDIFITNGYHRDVTNMDFVVYRHTELGVNPGAYNAGLKMLNTAPAVKLRNYIYKNEGNLTFTNMASAWGLDDKVNSNGAVYSDLDRDGDLDIIVNNLDDTALIYRNNSRELTSNLYLSVRFEGEGKNKSGMGAKAALYDSSGTRMIENYTTRGYLSAVENILHFGLGKNNSVKKLEVTWADGKTQVLTNIKPNSEIVFHYKDAVSGNAEKSPAPDYIFSESTARCKTNFIHTENDFIDFKNEPLLPHKFSQNGPGIAVGDVNGDGEEDFYIGGAMNQSGKLFIQKPGGVFESRFVKAFEDDKQFEDMGCLFFDADNDGDLDLIVASGGSEVYNLSGYYQSRLYSNSGDGNFSRNMQALPPMGVSSSCISAADFDSDGDLDLFIGGRIVPGNYPLKAKSYLLKNDNGHFTDVIADIAPDLEYCGLVCSALWTDFNNDGKTDIIVAGEWMPVSIFENQNGKFVNTTASAGLAYSAGWWNSIASADFDRDGDMDYVLGNFGLNNKIKASPSKPACIYANDFDKNGSLDAIICFTQTDGISYPIYSRDDMTDQVRPLKKKLIRYADYADLTIDQVFTPEEMKDVKIYYCHTFSTGYLRNDGGGKFSLSPLPLEAQFSPVYGMLTDDFDADGNTDILLTGNSYASEPEIERYDAGNGLLLKGDGQGNFSPVKCNQSGFYTPHDAKAMAKIQLQNGSREIYLVSNNNSAMQSYERNKKFLPKNLLRPEPLDMKAELFYKDNKKTIVEIPYGSGYLSQSSRKIRISAEVEYVLITNSQGKSRKVNFSPSPALSEK